MEHRKGRGKGFVSIHYKLLQFVTIILIYKILFKTKKTPPEIIVSFITIHN